MLINIIPFHHFESIMKAISVLLYEHYYFNILIRVSNKATLFYMLNFLRKHPICWNLQTKRRRRRRLPILHPLVRSLATHGNIYDHYSDMIILYSHISIRYTLFNIYIIRKNKVTTNKKT